MTDREKELVARRAYGEYAVNDHCARIWEKWRKKRRGSIYIEFLRVIHKPGYTWDEYEAVARPVQDAHPKEPSPPSPEPAPARSRRKRRKRKPKPVQEPGPMTSRQQILDALRRPWPSRGLSDEPDA